MCEGKNTGCFSLTTPVKKEKGSSRRAEFYVWMHMGIGIWIPLIPPCLQGVILFSLASDYWELFENKTPEIVLNILRPFFKGTID